MIRKNVIDNMFTADNIDDTMIAAHLRDLNAGYRVVGTAAHIDAAVNLYGKPVTYIPTGDQGGVQVQDTARYAQINR